MLTATPDPLTAGLVAHGELWEGCSVEDVPLKAQHVQLVRGRYGMVVSAPPRRKHVLDTHFLG